MKAPSSIRNIVRTLKTDEPSRKTARPVTRRDAILAVKLAAEAKRRVRVYSDMGFVPSSYRWPCQIQYVEGICEDGAWTFRTGWTRAQRSGAKGNLIVVQ